MVSGPPSAELRTAVASWFASAYAPDETARETGWPDVVSALWTRRAVLRYGENPHQGAALYARHGAPPGLATAELLNGKPMSYNNYVDAAAAWRTAFDFSRPCVAIIKHTNPCGIAIGTDIAAGERPQVLVPGGVWQGVRVKAGGRYALVGATVSPGFDYADFEIGSRDALLARWPKHTELIATLT